MPRSPEGTPRRSPLAKARDVLRRVDRKTVKGVVGAGIALGSVSLEATLPAGASVKSKAPEAVTASPAQNFRLETPDQIARSVQAELAAKGSKPKKDKDSEEAQGVTTTTRKEQKEINKQIAEIAENIEAVYSMTPEEFQAWAEANPMTQSGKAPWDFPHLRCNESVCPTTDVNTDTKTISYGGDTSRTVPWGPNLGLFTFNLDSGMVGQLPLLAGTVTIPLQNEVEGSATYSFGVTVFPDGTKFTFGWLDNLTAPQNPLLGEAQRSFTTSGAVQQTESKNFIGFDGIQTRLGSVNELLAQLSSDVGKPIQVYTYKDTILQNWADFSGDGTIINGSTIDARISGVDTNPFSTTVEDVVRGYISGDPDQFASAITEAESQGALSTKSDSADIVKWIKDRLGKAKGVDSVFTAYPLGTVVSIPGSTSPISADIQTSSSVKQRK